MCSTNRGRAGTPTSTSGGEGAALGGRVWVDIGLFGSRCDIAVEKKHLLGTFYTPPGYRSTDRHPEPSSWACPWQNPLPGLSSSSPIPLPFLCPATQTPQHALHEHHITSLAVVPFSWASTSSLRSSSSTSTLVVPSARHPLHSFSGLQTGNFEFKSWYKVYPGFSSIFGLRSSIVFIVAFGIGSENCIKTSCIWTWKIAAGQAWREGTARLCYPLCWIVGPKLPWGRAPQLPLMHSILILSSSCAWRQKTLYDDSSPDSTQAWPASVGTGLPQHPAATW